MTVPPRPTELKLLRGERKKSRLNPTAPKPRAGTPVMPRDLDREAKAVWRHVMREMEATGVIRPLHSDLLRTYCETVSRMRIASRQLAQQGPLVSGRDGNLVKNPLHQVVRDNATLMVRLAREMGLTPSSAEAIHLTGAQKVDEDAVSDYETRYGS